MKRCAYCMALHSRRGRCCCPEHARRVSQAVSTHRAKCRTILDKIAAEQYRLRVWKQTWRDVAMGRDREQRIESLFGVRPPS